MAQVGETLTPALKFRFYFCPLPLPHAMLHPPSTWLGDTRVVTKHAGSRPRVVTKHAGSRPLLQACHSQVFSFFVLTIVSLLESSLTLSHPNSKIDQSLLPLQRPIKAASPPGNSPGAHRISTPHSTQAVTALPPSIISTYPRISYQPCPPPDLESQAKSAPSLMYAAAQPGTPMGGENR